MKRFRFACPALASACLAAAVVVHAARPQYGGTLRVETQATVRSLDPAAAPADRSEATIGARVRSLVFETLVSVDPAGGLRPALAAAWESDDRGMRWRLTLRPNVVLHDGTPLEAWQVAAALRTTTSGWSVSTDADVVVIEASRPQADVPWMLADPRYAIAVRRSASEVVGSGPFRQERVEGSRIVLRAHDRHWAGRPFVDAIQIETGRTLRAQLADLEGGRAEVIEIEGADARRITEGGHRVASTRSLDLFLLVFEPHRADTPAEVMRRLVAGAIDRDAIANVLLQGRAEAAREILPPWLSGYPSAMVAASLQRTSRTNVSALPAEQRSIAIRVDPADTTAKSIAERVAVDMREAGFTASVQAPSGLAPRPDLRLVRVPLAATSADRALARLVADVGARTLGLASADLLNAGAPLDAVVRFERTLLQRAVLVPIVRVPQLYCVAESVDVWDGEPVSALGVWNFANLWIRPGSAAKP